MRHWGQRGKASKNTVFLGKRHDNKFIVENYIVVTAEAPARISGLGGLLSLRRLLWGWGSRSDHPRFLPSFEACPLPHVTMRTDVRTYGQTPQTTFRENRTFTESWLPFCVAFAPLFPKGNWPFFCTGNPPFPPPPLSVGSFTISAGSRLSWNSCVHGVLGRDFFNRFQSP